MSGLKQYGRDRELPAQLGDAQLGLPQDDELVALVADHLIAKGGPAPQEARWIFARWKPGTAVLGCWTLTFDDGCERLVSLKRYSSSRASEVADSFRVNDHMREAAAPLIPFAHLPELAAVLTSFPVDRALRGAARVVDLRRTGRALDEAGLWPGQVFRRRSSKLELLRYKPERRAVLALDVKLKVRSEGGSHPAGERRLGVRVLEPSIARRVVAHRGLCPPGLLPELLHSEPTTGLIFEEWVQGTPIASEDFSHATASAEVLARLHAGRAEAPPTCTDRVGSLQLLGRIPGLAERAAEVAQAPAVHSSVWIHGDFHPDQLTSTEHGLRLLDADDLRPGAPEQDLASWLADHLEHEEQLSLQAAASPLFAGYGKALQQLDLELLRGLVAEDLIARAAACLRRLQEDAVACATRLVERAHEATLEGLHL